MQQFFDGMAANDPKLMGDVLLPDGTNASVRTDAAGAPRIRVAQQKQFHGATAERRQIPGAHVGPRGHPPRATGGGLGAYEFQLNGKTTHCGVDVFNLLKGDGGWKIASISWTVEPDACAELKGKMTR